ncbi:MAG: Ku protein [Betaproteobacteria bacterium]
MARGLWKGALGFGRVNKPTGEDVPWAEIVKGYEHRDGKYVVLSAEELSEGKRGRSNVVASKSVEILAFVDRAQIPPQFFETPYSLAPGKRGEKAYALLREALRKAGKAGVATVVIRTRQYLALVLPQERYLILNTLRYADELKDFAELGVADSSASTRRCRPASVERTKPKRARKQRAA